MATMIEMLEDAQKFKVMSIFEHQLQPANPKLCIVTGKNVSGKSLLRKVLHNCHHDANVEYIHLSQSARCGNGGLGAMRSMVYGSEIDDSTGYNSTSVVTTALKTGASRDKPFSLMLDEPEIGCSEELSAALGVRIVRDFDTLTNLVGMIIVTHSRQLVKHLLPLNPTHLRMANDGMTLEQWVNREIVPVASLEDLKDEGHKKWGEIEKIIRKGKE
jgi:hypothetical protein